MTTTAQPEQRYRVIGTRPVRHDGVDKVTGAARYGADINLPGMLHARMLRSPHSHARIRSIDTSKAEALPGVVAVATAADFPIIENRMIDFAEVQGNARMIAENLLAKDKVLYVGHAVAAVCATNPHIAMEAMQLVEVDYEVLPTVLTWRDAMAEDAPLLHDDMTTYFRMERSLAATTPASRATSPDTSSTRSATSSRVSPKPTSSSSGNLTPKPCTRATSSPTCPPPCGPPTGA